MAHLIAAEQPVRPAGEPRPPVPLPWLGYAVLAGYVTFRLAMMAVDPHGELPAAVARTVWLGIGLACCAAPLLIPRVSSNRRFLALGLFAAMYAVMYVPGLHQLPGLELVDFWTTPVLYAAGWIAVRHGSRWAFLGLVAAPILTAIVWPFGPLRGGTGQLGGVRPFELFVAIDEFSFVLPAVAAVLVASAISYQAVSWKRGAAGMSWPYWLAVIALVAAMGGVVFVAAPTGLPVVAIVLGHVALGALRRRGMGGTAFAATAFALGYLEIAFFVWSVYQMLANFKIEF